MSNDYDTQIQNLKNQVANLREQSGDHKQPIEDLLEEIRQLKVERILESKTVPLVVSGDVRERIQELFRMEDNLEDRLHTDPPLSEHVEQQVNSRLQEIRSELRKLGVVGYV